MADYFLSDVHLRLDRPDRGERLAALAGEIGPSDRVIIVGDLCDFWFASRQRRVDPMRCPGLRALDQLRGRGGDVQLLLGNHDAWLGPFYEKRLGLEVRPQPLAIDSFGLRVRAEHGHLTVQGKSSWKALLEGRGFLAGFGMLPHPVAAGLERALDGVNAKKKAESDGRLIGAYRAQADTLAGGVDLAIFGHVHRAHDDASRAPRLIVLGDWCFGASYLRIDDSGAVHHVLGASASAKPGDPPAAPGHAGP